MLEKVGSSKSHVGLLSIFMNFRKGSKMEGKRKALCILLVIAMQVLFTGSLLYAGSIPQMINYQGSLTDTNGTPVPNGNYNIEFKIYDVASGGAPLWSEKWDSTTAPISQVTVVGGIFNVMLGFKVPIPVSFFADHPVTYLGIKVGTDSEMLPRQQITSVGYAFTAGNGVPKGGIIMWSGSVASIPEGWALCDGSNGTPDLRDRFVVSVGPSYNVGATGGSKILNFAHGHTVNDHVHTYSGNTGTISGEHVDRTKDNDLYDTAGNDHYHSYTGTTNGASNRGTDSQLSNAQDIRPPYYALAFIMKL
jgi:microcystin-dependent protein